MLIRSLAIRAAMVAVAMAWPSPAPAQFPAFRPSDETPARPFEAAPKKSNVTPSSPATRPAGLAPEASAAPAVETPAWVEEAGRRLESAVAELDRTRTEIADERIPLARTLDRLENELIDARSAYETAKRQFDGRALDLNNLRNEIKAREQERSYLSSLMGEYIRNFETRLHIAELARYAEPMEAARLAAENHDLPPGEAFAGSLAAVDASLGRTERLIGGDRFRGRAARPDGLVVEGEYALLGPVAYFASDDGSLAGIAEQRLGSMEPSVETFADPAQAEATREFTRNGWGVVPFDSSLGNARKIEQTRETLWQHIRKGGAVIWPILGVAAVAALVAIVKWITLSLVRMPREDRFARLLEAVGRRDQPAALETARGMRGAAGDMLRAGIEHMDQSKELIEETMFERMLDARFRFQRFLPVIAVVAACAPLLGLLGTVTGIISTFKLLTIFGSGDIKMLSAGISEALITTEFGLYVAIPSLLSHSFLSRKAKALSDRLERMAISFLGEVEKSKERTAAS